MPGLEANARRYRGFADLYNRVRPSPPPAVAELLLDYAGLERAGLVVDLGSGTGLSSRWSARWADAVVGIEPSDDMRAQAEAAGRPDNVSFRPGWAHDTALAGECADVVTAVQALHWMDPEPTLAEVGRILRPGGVFAALDCDWPPRVGRWETEAAWTRCRAVVKAYEDRLARGLTGAALHQALPASDLAWPAHFGRDAVQDRTFAAGVTAWSKDAHLGHMEASGLFRWCAELAAHTVEHGDHTRFVDLLRSQGDFQHLLAAGLDEETLGVTDLRATALRTLGTLPRPFWFTYRVRLAVK